LVQLELSKYVPERSIYLPSLCKGKYVITTYYVFCRSNFSSFFADIVKCAYLNCFAQYSSLLLSLLWSVKVYTNMFPKAMNCMYFVERRLSNCDEKFCTIFWTKISQISYQELYLLSAIAIIKLLLRYNGFNRCHYRL
jgi:hypothetical protein